MIISVKHRFVFTAFNKTGTTSVEEALSPYNSPWMYGYLRLAAGLLIKERRMFKHIRPLHLRRLMGERAWSRYFTFSFVRNPWSRAVSLYSFHRKRSGVWPLAAGSFENWVRGGGTGTARRSMAEFVCDDKGCQIVDFIGRYESLGQDFQKACDRVGLPVPDLPHLNRSTDGEYRRFYTDETRALVAAWAAEDIERFGYSF